MANVDRDENVNGRHGAFSRSYLQCAHASSHVQKPIKQPTFFNNDSTSYLAAFNDQVVRNNSTHRQRLEFLTRMEEKFRKHQLKKVLKKSENTLSIFVLDITNVLSDDCSASWMPSKENDHSGPDERILYSLVVGKRELIVFGGIRKNEQTVIDTYNTGDSMVYNDLHFINPPQYII